MIEGDSTTITLASAPTRSNYYFTGWWTAASGGTKAGNAGASYTLSADTTLYAHWGQYTLTYNANGGTGAPDKVSSTSNAVTVSTTQPTRAGYTFTGWYTAASGGTEAGATVDLSKGNVTLYAQWTPSKYTVTLNAHGGSGGTASVTVTYGAAMPAITKPSRPGYTFGGYARSSGGTLVYHYDATGASVRNWDLAQGTTLYAQWTANTYTVHKLCGYSGGPTWNDQSATFDAAFSATAPSRTGYRFKGWYVTAGLNASTAKYGPSAAEATNAIANSSTLCKNGEPSGTVYFKNLTAVADGTATITAQWTANTYTVTFDANGGSNSMSNLSCTYGTEKPLPANTFTRAGYTFDGWATSANGAKAYNDKASVINLTAVNNGTFTLYAHWVANSYTVTVNAAGGTFPTTGNPWKGGTVGYDQVVTLYPVTAPAGKSFSGWKITAGLNTTTAKYGTSSSAVSTAIASTTLMKNGTSPIYFKNLTPTANGSVAITAQYADIKYTLTLTRDSHLSSITYRTRASSSASWSSWTTNSSSTTVTVSDLVKDNQWQAYATPKAGYAESQGRSSTSSAASGTISGNYTLAFTSSAASYTVTLDRKGGTGGTASVDATYGSAMPAITKPSRPGYTFGGYYTSTNGGGTQYYTAAGASAKAYDIAGTTTLYAKWTAITVTVTFDANGGTLSGSETKNVTYDSTYGTLPTASIAGASFLGWSKAQDDSSLRQVVKTTTTVTESSNHTLYAQYSDGYLAYITYELNGGAFSDGQDGPDMISYSTASRIPAPRKLHWRFGGWKVSGEVSTAAKWGLQENDTDTSITSQSQLVGNAPMDDVWVYAVPLKDKAQVTFTAVWLPITYQLTIDNTNGSGAFSLSVSGDGIEDTYIAPNGQHTFTINAGANVSVAATMLYAARTEYDFKRPFAVVAEMSGAATAEYPFSRAGGVAYEPAVFRASHEFGDNETDQTWNMAFRVVRVILDNTTSYGDTMMEEWLALKPTLQFADNISISDNTTTDVMVLAASNEKWEPVEWTRERVAPQAAFVRASGDTAVGTSVDAETVLTLAYDIKRVNISAEYDSYSAATAASGRASVFVGIGDWSDTTDEAWAEYGTDEVQIPYGTGATFHAQAPSGCRFAGWFDQEGKMLSPNRTYYVQYLTADTVLYAKLSVQVLLAAARESQELNDSNTAIAVCNPAGTAQVEALLVPYSFYAVLGDNVEIRAIAKSEPAVFAGWYVYTGNSGNPLGQMLEYAASQVVRITSAGIQLVARFTDMADIHFVAIYSRNAGTHAFGDFDADISLNAGTGDNAEIKSITRSEYMTNTGFIPLDKNPNYVDATTTPDVDEWLDETAVFLQVTGIQRLVCMVDDSDAQFGLSRIMLMRLPSMYETVLSTQSGFAAVVNANVAFILDWGDVKYGLVRVTAPLSTTESVKGQARVGSRGANIAVNEQRNGRIIDETGYFELGRTATVYAFAENGWEFVGWYTNPDGLYEPVSTKAEYSFEMVGSDLDNDESFEMRLYAVFRRAQFALYKWEGSSKNKSLRWKSKVYELSKPANLTGVRVDAAQYPLEKFRAEYFSSPDAAPREAVEFSYGGEQDDRRVKSQSMRRLPAKRPERFFQLEVESDAEVDAITVSTSAEGLAT